jgi:hypothetical protein
LLYTHAELNCLLCFRRLAGNYTLFNSRPAQTVSGKLKEFEALVFRLGLVMIADVKEGNINIYLKQIGIL